MDEAVASHVFLKQAVEPVLGLVAIFGRVAFPGFGLSLLDKRDQYRHIYGSLFVVGRLIARRVAALGEQIALDVGLEILLFQSCGIHNQSPVFLVVCQPQCAIGGSWCFPG